jgi:hypothetical protein
MAAPQLTVDIRLSGSRCGEEPGWMRAGARGGSASPRRQENAGRFALRSRRECVLNEGLRRGKAWAEDRYMSTSSGPSSRERFRFPLAEFVPSPDACHHDEIP